MESRHDKITNFLSRAGMRPGLQVRSAGVRAPDKDTGEDIRWVLATEHPVESFDWKTYEFWPEILLMDGVVIPAINQVPLLDNHYRDSVKNQLGSVNDFQKISVGEFTGLDGLVRFAADKLSQDTKQKVLDGHLTDGSVGYITDYAVYIEDNTEAKIKGVAYQGPLKVVYSWRLPEFSLTPIGADVFAKIKTIMD